MPIYKSPRPNKAMIAGKIDSLLAVLSTYRGEAIGRGRHPVHDAMVSLERLLMVKMKPNGRQDQRSPQPLHVVWLSMLKSSRGRNSVGYVGPLKPIYGDDTIVGKQYTAGLALQAGRAAGMVQAICPVRRLLAIVDGQPERADRGEGRASAPVPEGERRMRIFIYSNDDTTGDTGPSFVVLAKTRDLADKLVKRRLPAGHNKRFEELDEVELCEFDRIEERTAVEGMVIQACSFYDALLEFCED